MTWIYIQTSISEGLPVSVIEAGLTGKPVVCTNVGGCAELLANPNSGGYICRGLGSLGRAGGFSCRCCGACRVPRAGTQPRKRAVAKTPRPIANSSREPRRPGADGSAFGFGGPQPPMFGRLVAPKDAAMIAYAQLEVLGMLPTLQVRCGWRAGAERRPPAPARPAAVAEPLIARAARGSVS
jgi:hypothetical protein